MKILFRFPCYNLKGNIIIICLSSDQSCSDSTPRSCWASLLVFVSQPCPLLTHLYGNSMFPRWFYQGLMGGEVHYFPTSSTSWLNNHQGNCCLNTAERILLLFIVGCRTGHVWLGVSNKTYPTEVVLLLHQDVLHVNVGGMCLGALPSCWAKKASLSSLTSMRKVMGMNSSIFSLLWSTTQPGEWMSTCPQLVVWSDLPETNKCFNWFFFF